MHQKDHSLIDEMKITTDAIVANQTDNNSVISYEKGSQKITYLNFNERGVGLNRNNALMRSDADILVFADADEVFVEEYDSIITQAYEDRPDADVIIFNVGTIGDNLGRRTERKSKKLHFWNIFNYGAPRITVRNDVIKRENIYFSRLFGGGALYSAGEDTLFLYDLYKSGLNIYIQPTNIGNVKQDESTWFTGYNEKYFYDKGAAFSALSRRFGFFLCAALLIKNRNLWFGSNISLIKGIKLSYKGFKGFNDLLSYGEYIKICLHE